MILELLRNEMKKNNIDLYIIPTADPHSSEYLSEYYKERQLVSGFTGSAGLFIATEDKAKLWTDGRYYIQASKELYDGIDLMKMGDPSYPTYDKYILDNLEENSIVGLNPLYFSQDEYEKLYDELQKKNIEIKLVDLIYDIWKNRPKLSSEKIFIHDEKFAGKSSVEKIELVKDKLKKEGADLTIISSLADISWLFNIRGNDIDCTPVVFSYALISNEETILFIDKNKAKDDVSLYLNKFCKIMEYEDVFSYLESINNKKILIDTSRTNKKIYDSISRNNDIEKMEDVTIELKAIKNDVEIKNQKQAYIKDGIALVKFIYWLKHNKNLKEIDEYKAAVKLRKFREEQEYFIEDSFETISAYKENAAMMHYSADENNCKNLDKEGFLLVDSGAQYLDGTTDITRTIALGKLTKEEIRDFTTVLKSHLMLLNAKFLSTAKGSQLDAIARYEIWKEEYDYKCGTGHGVGYFLGVHENPPSINGRNNDLLKPNMVVSNEPGIYKEGKFGIRIENIMLVENFVKNESGTFYKFSPLSYVPIEIEAIDVNRMTDEELDILNKYHEEVYNKLKAYLNDNERMWLREVTKSLSR